MLKENLKKNAKIKELVLWMITSKYNPRPRWWIRWFVTPFTSKLGHGAKIRRYARMDIFPWNKFIMGNHATIEDYTVVSNGVGDVILGDDVRVGIGSSVLGPVTIKSGCGLGQNVFVSGFNHIYIDGTKNSKYQSTEKHPVTIDEDTHLGANSVVVAGVHIGKRCQIGAGSVVTKDVPDYSIVVGNPARVIKRFNLETSEWEKI